MHFVDCGGAPQSLLQPLVKTDAAGNFVWDSDVKEYRAFIEYLGACFSGNCAYCEVGCGPKSDPRISSQTDHFLPRSHFPSLTFTWENLMYVCQRCNTVKSNKFPGITVKPGDQALRKYEDGKPGYVDLALVDEYVNPRDPNEPAETFFDFNVATGEILEKPDLDDLKWAKARLTIRDLDLNPVGGPRKYRLQGMRLDAYIAYKAALAEELAKNKDKEFIDKIPTYAFSSFISFCRGNEAG